MAARGRAEAAWTAGAVTVMSAPLTVGLPTSTFLPALGGVEVGLHNIASRLAARGHRPIVIAPQPHVRALRREGWQLPYEVLSFPPKVWGLLRHVPIVGLTALEAFFACLRWRHGIDVWHVTVGYPTGIAFVRFARRWGGAPHLVRCVGEDIQTAGEIGYGARLNPSVDLLVRRWLHQADALVAITESVAEEYRRLGVEALRIAKIPNGVDLSRFQVLADVAAIRGRHAIGEEDFVFLSIGRNHPKKNFAALVDAAEVLTRSGVGPFKVVLGGEGVERLRPIAEARGLARQFRFLAPPAVVPGPHGLLLPQDEVVALYRMADAFVFPSLVETFGIVLVEAMAAGLPVVTTDAPGCRDVIRHGQDGMIVPPGDAAALAAGMERLMREPALRDELRKKSLRRAEDFSWDRVVDRYVSLYRDLIHHAS